MFSRQKPPAHSLPTPPETPETVSDVDTDTDGPDDEHRTARPPPLQTPPRPTRPGPSSRTCSDHTDYLAIPSPVTSSRPSSSPKLAGFAFACSRRRHLFLSSGFFWLFLYFLFNLTLTLYNKLVLVRFPFPYTLTALHAFSGTIGSYLAMEFGYFTPEVLTTRETLILTAFSFLYTINIAVSNLSLQLVTVPFHQVVRAATPLFIIALSYFFFGRVLSASKITSLIPVVAGVGLATYGDYYFTVGGLLLTLLGTLLAALKTIATNLLQTGRTAHNFLFKGVSPARPIKLHPLDLLLRLSPLAFVQCVAYAHFSGELNGVRAYSIQNKGRDDYLSGLAVNAAMAFGLNVVSFTANSKVGPLSITVAANVKQVLTVLLGVSIFNLVITPANALGIGLTLFGGAWYAVIELRERRRPGRLPIAYAAGPGARHV